MSQSHHGFVGSEGMTLEEARDLQETLLAVLHTDEISEKVNAAARLLLSRDYEGSIRAYQAIAVQHPERRGDCEGQIGAAHYFLGDYEAALSHYESARDHGADPDMMQDNIDEARQALSKGGASGEDEDGSVLLGGFVLLGILVALVAGGYLLLF